MSKLVTLSDVVYNRLKPYTNDLPHRSRQKISFSEAINTLLNFREGDYMKLDFWHIYIPLSSDDTSYLHLDVDGKGINAGIVGHIWGVEFK